MNKSVTKNYIYNLIYQILIMVIPLITTPYLARVLGAEKLGIYNYTLSVVTYFVLIGSLGVALYGQKEIAYVQDDIEVRSRKFYNIFFMKCCTMVISLMIFYVVFCLQGEYHVFYSILILEMVANVFDISWYFQGLEEFKKTIGRNLLIKITALVLIFIFIKNESDLNLYFWIYVLTNFIGNISLWGYMPKYVKPVEWKKLKIISNLKPCIILFIPQIATQIYTVLDKTMIGSMVSDISEVAYYEQPQKIVKIALALITALGTVMLPRVANYFAKKEYKKIKNAMENSFGFAAMLSVPMMFGFIAISKSLIPWFLGPGYENSIIILEVISPIIIFISFTNVIGMQYLLPTKRDKHFTISVVSGAITNLVANFLFIKMFKSVGAAIATDISELVVLIVMVYFTKNNFNYREIFKNLFKYIIFGVIMLISCFIIELIFTPSFKCMIIQTIVGIIIYLVLLVVFKDKFLKMIVNKVCKSRKM